MHCKLPQSASVQSRTRITRIHKQDVSWAASINLRSLSQRRLLRDNQTNVLQQTPLFQQNRQVLQSKKTLATTSNNNKTASDDNVLSNPFLNPLPEENINNNVSNIKPQQAASPSAVFSAKEYPEFEAVMKRLIVPPKGGKVKIGVALSGGPDSIALTLLTQEWCTKQNCDMSTYTIDHRIRPESKQEALTVHSWMRKRGIHHHILPIEWEEGVPPVHAGKLQERCREKRYQLLEKRCEEDHVTHLLFAQHSDDQIETLFIRLSRKSGIDGLACMEESRNHSTATFRVVRPLLSFNKEQLISICEQYRHEYVNDPSNVTDIYFRNRIRKALTEQVYPAGEISRQQFLALIEDIRDAKNAYYNLINAWIQRNVRMHTMYGFALVPMYEYFQELAPYEAIAVRFWEQIVQAVSGEMYPRTKQILQAMTRLTLQKALTIGSVMLEVDPRRKRWSVVFTPAPSDANALIPIEVNVPTYWHGRYKITVRNPGKVTTPLYVRPMQLPDYAQIPFGLRKHIPERFRSGLPVIVTHPSPAKGEVVSIPHCKVHKHGFLSFAQFMPRFPLQAQQVTPPDFEGPKMPIHLLAKRQDGGPGPRRMTPTPQQRQQPPPKQRRASPEW